MRAIIFICDLLLVHINIRRLTAYTADRHIPQEFEIIHPTVFHHSIGPISSTAFTSSHRKRRSALWDLEQISVNISTLSNHYHIKLTPNRQLLSPGFKVYHRHHGNKDHEKTYDDVIDVGETSEWCHFHGVIESHNQSKAALSLCRGVTGVLVLPDDDFVIEPLPTHMRNLHDSNHSDDNTHIIYRKSSLTHHNYDGYHSKLGLDRSQIVDQIFHRARRKRSVGRRSHERAVETLVVIDKEMYTNHGRENLTTYVLSIFNVVSQLYQDTTLGYPIKIILVGLVYLDGDEPGLHISHHADRTLNSFCQWQATISKRKQHDHAVLLTGIDICSYRNAPCDTLGFAPIEGMCSELRSCIVNEDTGLSTAFTVAHEIGHNFGMLHDGDGNTCHETTGNIMSPTLTADGGIFHWSTCSRQYMRKFLNSVRSECLTHQARQAAELKFPDKLPGEIFDADTQCKWQFGKHSKQCMFTRGQDNCENLWCYRDTAMCETKFLPAAEGTACGYGMWCKQGRCTRYGARSPTPVNGWWSAWGEWSKCSRSCGGGVKTRKRECNNPRGSLAPYGGSYFCRSDQDTSCSFIISVGPQYGGKPCEGGELIHKMCNIPDCGSSGVDFREAQCEEYNRLQFRGWYYRWRSYRDRRRNNVDDQCKLYCKADGYDFYYTMATEVTDGTRCNDYSADICVQGQCRHVGCDLIVGSSVRKDICGMCSGDNSTCDLIENTFTAQPRKNTYNPVVVIPRGARSIIIQELGISPNNFLVLRDSHGKYQLNGNWGLNKEGVYNIRGTKFIYRRTYNRPESLQADGPLLEDTVVEVLIQAENLGVHYSFTVPKKSNDLRPRRHNYTWSVVLTKCSESCAGGKQIVTSHCHRDHREEVDPAYCDPRSKPATGTFACNTEPCKPRWASEPWGVCNKACGGGKQKRRVYCVQRISSKEDRRVKRKLCDKKRKPIHKRECNTQECPPVWYKGSWSKCSVSCGKGIQTRELACRSKTSAGYVRLRDSMCTQANKPVVRKGCRYRKCPDLNAQWVITSWTSCSRSCGEGIRTRQMKCARRRSKSQKLTLAADRHCEHLPNITLPLSETCKLKPCPGNGPSWYASPWSECSVTCGNGQQTRLVHCIHEKQTKLASDCDPNSKPQDTQICKEEKCSRPDPLCVDHFSWCGLVPKHNICHHTFYGAKCCLSCKRRAS